MKKSKIMLSTLAAAVFATSAGALVACGEDVQLPDGLANKSVIEVTFDANGGVFADNTAVKKVSTDLNGLISMQPETPTYNDKVFTGYYLEKNADGTTKITYGTDGYKFTTAITVYAHWQDPQQGGEQNDEYVITLNAGTNGTCATSSLTTVNGKITLPAVTPNSGFTFKGWYTEATGGEKVENDKVYTDKATLYAQYEQVQQGSTEYTITLNAGENGSYSATTLTTTGGKLVDLTDATPNSGYTFDGWYTAEVGGDLVTSNYTFTDDGNIYAHYSPVQQDNVDPNPPARVYTAAKWNGTAMTDVTSEVGRAWVDDATNPEGGYYNNHTLADEFTATLTLTVQTEVTFTIGDDDKAISMWVKHAQAIQVKVGDTLVPYDGQPETYGGATSSNGSVVLAAGTYTVYLTNYGTAGNDDLVLWVEGEQTGEFGGGGEERPTTDPEPPARVYNTATINDEAMEDVSDTIDRTWVEYPDWSGYQNHTLADKFKAELTVTAVTKYTFKGNGTALSNLWIKYATGLEIKIDDTIATQAKNGNSITLAPGTYTLYLENYNDGGTNLWIEGTKTGEWEGGGGGEQTETSTYKVGESGTATDLTVKALTTDEVNEGMTAQWWIDNGVFQAGDKLYFNINGTDITFEVEAASSGVYTTSSTYVEIKTAGTFKIYVKQYGTSYKIYAGREPDASDIQANDIAADGGVYLIGSVQNTTATWSNCYEKGFKLTERADGKYEIVMSMTDGDNFKFYKTPTSGNVTGSTVTWVGSIGTEDIDDYVGLVGDNLGIKADGKYYFIVDVAKGEIYVSYSANGTPTEPSTEAPVYECFLRGEWDGATDWGKGWGMTKQADGSYQKKFVVTNQLTFKVYIEDGNGQAWKNAVDPNSEIKPSGSDNLTLNAGTYIIVWKDGKISVKAA